MRHQPFFVVWNPDARAPTMKHPTYNAAEKEARRLARSNPEQSFFVLAAIAEAKKIEVGLTKFVINPDVHAPDCECDDRIPF